MLDLDRYRLREHSLSQIKPKNALRRRKGSFLKGPIPISWLEKAGGLPGKTLHVAVALWFAHGFEKQSRFRFTPKWYVWLNIGPHALRRALQRLKEAGLIRLEYRPGRSPIVTLLDAPEETES